MNPIFIKIKYFLGITGFSLHLMCSADCVSTLSCTAAVLSGGGVNSAGVITQATLWIPFFKCGIKNLTYPAGGAVYYIPPGMSPRGDVNTLLSGGIAQACTHGPGTQGMLIFCSNGSCSTDSSKIQQFQTWCQTNGGCHSVGHPFWTGSLPTQQLQGTNGTPFSDPILFGSAPGMEVPPDVMNKWWQTGNNNTIANAISQQESTGAQLGAAAVMETWTQEAIEEAD